MSESIAFVKRLVQTFLYQKLIIYRENGGEIHAVFPHPLEFD